MWQICRKVVMIISFLFFEKAVNILHVSSPKWITHVIWFTISTNDKFCKYNKSYPLVLWIFFFFNQNLLVLAFIFRGIKIPGFSMLLNITPSKKCNMHWFQSIKLVIPREKILLRILIKKITQLKWEHLPNEYSHLLLRLWSAPVPTFHCMVMTKDLKLLKSSFRIIGFFITQENHRGMEAGPHQK